MITDNVATVAGHGGENLKNREGLTQWREARKGKTQRRYDQRPEGNGFLPLDS
jgi:hypothetical protein